MHVPGGESWPCLAGLNADYIVKQLHDFKEGHRQSASMMSFANMLDDSQIAERGGWKNKKAQALHALGAVVGVSAI
nr:hypothetical protein [Halomonas sp.]